MQQSQTIASSHTLKLVTYGRITGLPHIVELRFATSDGTFFVLAGHSRGDWVLNALGSGKSKIRVGELVYQVSPRIATSIEKEKTIVEFRRKYGSQVVNQWYKNAEFGIRLDPREPPNDRGVTRGEFQTLASFDQWKAQSKDYYRSVTDAFDSASEEYDFTISHNYINTWIRKKSISELARLTRPDDTLIEIGCGTGAEAIQISKFVKRIIATDISEGMLAILKKKISARKLDNRILPARVGAAEIGNLRTLLPNGKVRVAYSFNGALNCEPRINDVPRQLHSIIEQNGYFLCSLRNTLCLPEALTHSAALQFDRVSSRKNQPTMVSVGGRDIPSYYFSPSSFAKIFHHFFRVKKMIGLPAILPPAYLSNYYLRTGRARVLIERFESVLGSRFPLNRFGDQTLLVFERA